MTARFVVTPEYPVRAPLFRLAIKGSSKHIPNDAQNVLSAIERKLNAGMAGCLPARGGEWVGWFTTCVAFVGRPSNRIVHSQVHLHSTPLTYPLPSPPLLFLSLLRWQSTLIFLSTRARRRPTCLPTSSGSCSTASTSLSTRSSRPRATLPFACAASLAATASLWPCDRRAWVRLEERGVRG